MIKFKRDNFLSSTYTWNKGKGNFRKMIISGTGNHQIRNAYFGNVFKVRKISHNCDSQDAAIGKILKSTLQDPEFQEKVIKTPKKELRKFFRELLDEVREDVPIVHSLSQGRAKVTSLNRENPLKIEAQQGRILSMVLGNDDFMEIITEAHPRLVPDVMRSTISLINGLDRLKPFYEKEDDKARLVEGKLRNTRNALKGDAYANDNAKRIYISRHMM